MTPSIRRGFIDTGRCLSGSLIFHLDALENYLYSDHPLLYSSFMTSEKLMEMDPLIDVAAFQANIQEKKLAMTNLKANLLNVRPKL